MKLSKFGVFVALLLSLGISILTPGILMRIEHVPPARPYVSVNMCKTKDGNYKGSSIMCGSSSDPTLPDHLIGDTQHDAQVINLHDKMLVAGVTYVPQILIPNLAVDGEISFKLSSPNTVYFQNTDGSRVVVVRRWNDLLAGSFIPVYRPVPRTRFDLRECQNIKKGCKHELSSDMKELLLTGTAFTIEPSQLHPEDVYAANLTLTVSTALLKGPALHQQDLFTAPQLFLSFRQSELSFVQSKGVMLLFIGSFLCVLSLALIWLYKLFSRPKGHERAAVGGSHSVHKRW